MTPMIELSITDISGPAEASPGGPEALSMRPGIFLREGRRLSVSSDGLCGFL